MILFGMIFFGRLKIIQRLHFNYQGIAEILPYRLLAHQSTLHNLKSVDLS